MPAVVKEAHTHTHEMTQSGRRSCCRHLGAFLPQRSFHFLWCLILFACLIDDWVVWRAREGWSTPSQNNTEKDREEGRVAAPVVVVVDDEKEIHSPVYRHEALCALVPCVQMVQAVTYTTTATFQLVGVAQSAYMKYYWGSMNEDQTHNGDDDDDDDVMALRPLQRLFLLPQESLSNYYEVLTSSFLMDSGGTIRITLSDLELTTVTYKNYVDAYVLPMNSKVGLGDTLKGEQQQRENVCSSPMTREKEEEGANRAARASIPLEAQDNEFHTSQKGEVTAVQPMADSFVTASFSSSSPPPSRSITTSAPSPPPKLSNSTAFFFCNQPRLSCLYNSPALMTAQTVETSLSVTEARNHVSAAAATVGATVWSTNETDRLLTSSPASHPFPSAAAYDTDAMVNNNNDDESGADSYVCRSHIPSPTALRAPSTGTLLTSEYLRTDVVLVIKVFKSDMWFRFTDGVALEEMTAFHDHYNEVGRKVMNDETFLDRLLHYPYNLNRDPAKICSVPALYTVPLDGLLRDISSDGTTSYRANVTLRHMAAQERIIVVLAQCSGVPLTVNVMVELTNSGRGAGSAEHYYTSVIYFIFVVAYALLFFLLAIMLLRCEKKRNAKLRPPAAKVSSGSTINNNSSSSSAANHASPGAGGSSKTSSSAATSGTGSARMAHAHSENDLLSNSSDDRAGGSPGVRGGAATGSAAVSEAANARHHNREGHAHEAGEGADEAARDASGSFASDSSASLTSDGGGDHYHRNHRHRRTRRGTVLSLTDCVRSVSVSVARWWDESHILIMEPALQWMLTVLLPVKCLIAVLGASEYTILSNDNTNVMNNYALSTMSNILNVCASTTLFVMEILVGMGWGLVTEKITTGRIVLLCVGGCVAFVIYILVSTCASDGIASSFTMNQYVRAQAGVQCMSFNYLRTAVEIFFHAFNALQMFLLTSRLGKAVVNSTVRQYPRKGHAVQRGDSPSVSSQHRRKAQRAKRKATASTVRREEQRRKRRRRARDGGDGTADNDLSDDAHARSSARRSRHRSELRAGRDGGEDRDSYRGVSASSRRAESRSVATGVSSFSSRSSRSASSYSSSSRSTSSSSHSGSSSSTSSSSSRCSSSEARRVSRRRRQDTKQIANMHLFLRYSGMCVPFAFVLLWPILFLSFSFSFFGPEDYYMEVVFEQFGDFYLLGFMILFLRKESPFYC